MSGENIHFTITPDGMKMDASNFEGGECITDLEKIRAKLKEIGVETAVENQKLKHEVHLVTGGANVISSYR